MEKVIRELNEIVERLSHLYENFPPVIMGNERGRYGLINEFVVLRKVEQLLNDCKAACEAANKAKISTFLRKYAKTRKDAAASEKFEGDVFAQEEALFGLNYFPAYGKYWINRDAKFSEEDQRTCDELYNEYCETYN